MESHCPPTIVMNDHVVYRNKLKTQITIKPLKQESDQIHLELEHPLKIMVPFEHKFLILLDSSMELALIEI